MCLHKLGRILQVYNHVINAVRSVNSLNPPVEPVCLPELRAEVEVIEQMSSSSGSSSSDSGSCSGSGDDSSSSDGEEERSPAPHHQPSPNRLPMVNGTDKSQSSNQLMNTLSKYRIGAGDYWVGAG